MKKQGIQTNYRAHASNDFEVNIYVGALKNITYKQRNK